jgi:hypothetical protein
MGIGRLGFHVSKKHQNWVKHLDFIITDLFEIFLAYSLAIAFYLGMFSHILLHIIGFSVYGCRSTYHRL